MATIKIPPVLRASVGNEKQGAGRPAANIGEVLRRPRPPTYRPTQDQLFGCRRRAQPATSTSYLNDEGDVRVLDGLDTAVGDTTSW